MTQPATVPPSAQKRGAILAATLRLIARSGLHNTPMSAIAREAGVAAGTPYVYFASKEELINALYLELISNRDEVVSEAVDPALPAGEEIWQAWSSIARWHLENQNASNFIQQCEAAAILTEETLARQSEIRAAGLDRFVTGVRHGLLRDLPIEVFYALFMGPILILAGIQEKGETEVTDEMLRLTFDGVRRSILARAEGAGAG